MREWLIRSAGQCDECVGNAAEPDPGGMNGVGDLLERSGFGALSQSDQDADRDVDRPTRGMARVSGQVDGSRLLRDQWVWAISHAGNGSG